MDLLKNPAQLQVETMTLYVLVETKDEQKKSGKRLVHTRRTQISRNVSRTNGLDTLYMGCRTGSGLESNRNIKAKIVPLHAMEALGGEEI
jgi:hypothetical protein